MRDLIAGVVAVLLVLLAASLATTLRMYRRRREDARRSEQSLGRRVIAEIPLGSEMVLFSEDRARFHLGDRSIDKDLIRAVRVLINGSPIAAAVSKRYPQAAGIAETTVEDRPDGIARDRWDVAIEAETGALLIECGAIRERVSQELARVVFDAVKADVERRNAGSDMKSARRGGEAHEGATRHHSSS